MAGRLCRVMVAAVAAALVGVACTPVALPPGAPAGGYGTATTGSERAAYTVLAPGNGGMDGPTNRDIDDQRVMYDRLDDPVADGTLTDADLARYFKAQPLGAPGRPGDRVEDMSGLGRRVTIRWDEWSVPHVQGETATDVAFGAGFAVAEARFVVLEFARILGRSGLLEVVGAPSDLVGVLDELGELPRIAYSEEELRAQIDLAVAQAPSAEEGQEVLAAVDAYLAGINEWMSRAISWPPILTAWGVTEPRPWTRTDLVAAGIVVNDIFGYGGGDEVGNAAALWELVSEHGLDVGGRLFRDLRQADDPAATPSTSVRAVSPRFASPGGPVSDSAPHDPDSLAIPDPSTTRMVRGYDPGEPPHASNYVAVAGSRTADGNPILVGGPQTGYFAPELLIEMELQGGGYKASGMTFPGLGPWILIGRSDHYAWTATAGGSDQVDQRIEKLCNPAGGPVDPSSMHYEFRGECRAMTAGDPNDPLGMPRTVHGPVSGRSTVQGMPVAISQQRASRGLEATASVAFWRLSRGELDGAEDFAPLMSHIPMSFNWLYVDAEDIAYFHSGLFPIRAAGVDPDLPSWGTGEWEWRGFLDPSEHPQELNPSSGYALSWNNKPAPGWASADDTWGVGAVQRVDLLEDRVRSLDDATLADVVSVAQDAATSDLRATHVISTVLEVLADDPAPSRSLEDLRGRLGAYVESGANRRDRNHDGLYDDPMTAVVEHLWEPLVEEVFGTTLGSYVDSDARRPIGLDDAPSSYGSAFDASAWYSLVDREIRRTLMGEPRPEGVPAICGDGDERRCRDALWAALRRGRWATQQQQIFAGDISMWRRPTFPDQVRFIPFVTNLNSMRWTNRPTYQMAIQFGG